MVDLLYTAMLVLSLTMVQSQVRTIMYYLPAVSEQSYGSGYLNMALFAMMSHFLW